MCLDWANLSLFAFPARLQTVPFRSRVRFSGLMRKNAAHLLSTVRATHAPRIICLSKSAPATEHKHNHSLIVIMGLQLEMPQCCRLAKVQNKHQIHLEKKKISLAFMWAGCRLIKISDLWCTRSLWFIFPYSFFAMHYYYFLQSSMFFSQISRLN